MMVTSNDGDCRYRLEMVLVNVGVQIIASGDDGWQQMILIVGAGGVVDNVVERYIVIANDYVNNDSCW